MQVKKPISILVLVVLVCAVSSGYSISGVQQPRRATIHNVHVGMSREAFEAERTSEFCDVTRAGDTMEQPRPQVSWVEDEVKYVAGGQVEIDGECLSVGPSLELLLHKIGAPDFRCQLSDSWQIWGYESLDLVCCVDVHSRSIFEFLSMDAMEVKSRIADGIR